jgi:hypothetical protein
MTARKCCCGNCDTADCIDGDLIGSGCCTGCAPLLLWCERPGYTQEQSYTFTSGGFGNVTCQTHYRLTQPAMDPVQAIYHFEGSYFRCRFPTPGAGLESLLSDQPRCLDPNCDARQDCCAGPPYTGCECGHTWLSDYRRDTWLLEPESKWGVEVACFKGGSALSATVGSLYNTFLCIVHREKWWRIPTDQCAPVDRIYVPGCTQSPSGGDCGGVAFNTTQLVPERWIFACSGVPLFSWEVDDAVARGVISGAEATQLLADIGNKLQPSQATLSRLYQAGYLKLADWREQQLQEWRELDTRFPSAGYGSCVQACATMQTVGAYRKRLTAATPQKQPILRRADSISSMLTLQVAASCFKQYPGDIANQADYDFWAERGAWVYFRAVPGGWSWACWGYTEAEVLAGSGRNGMGCIEALKGNPRPPVQCQSLSAICTGRPQIPFCNYCTGGCDSCGQSTAQGCGPFPALPVATSCENLVIDPQCEGVRFVFAQYYQKNTLAFDEDLGSCTLSSRTECLYASRSYLVEARRDFDSWADACPYRCRREKPPLEVFNAWPAIGAAHYGPRTICTEVVVPSTPPLQTVNDLCCSGYCWDYTYPGGFPCLQEVGDTGASCAATNECPPHSTTGQLSCIGFTPDCP